MRLHYAGDPSGIRNNDVQLTRIALVALRVLWTDLKNGHLVKLRATCHPLGVVQSSATSN